MIYVNYRQKVYKKRVKSRELEQEKRQMRKEKRKREQKQKIEHRNRKEVKEMSQHDTEIRHLTDELRLAQAEVNEWKSLALSAEKVSREKDAYVEQMEDSHKKLYKHIRIAATIFTIAALINIFIILVM